MLEKMYNFIEKKKNLISKINSYHMFLIVLMSLLTYITVGKKVMQLEIQVLHKEILMGLFTNLLVDLFPTVTILI